MTKSQFVAVLEDVLTVPPGTLKESDTRSSIEQWSSLADVEIYTIISNDLGVEVDADVLSYESIGQMLDVLEQKNAFVS